MPDVGILRLLNKYLTWALLHYHLARVVLLAVTLNVDDVETTAQAASVYQHAALSAGIACSK